MRGEHEDRDRERAEHDEVQRAVDRDQPQDDLVAQRLAARRQLDLGALRRGVAGRRARRRQRQPRVAAQAAVPAHPVDLARDERVLRARSSRASMPDRARARAARTRSARSGTAAGTGSARRARRRAGASAASPPAGWQVSAPVLARGSPRSARPSRPRSR